MVVNHFITESQYNTFAKKISKSAGDSQCTAGTYDSSADIMVSPNTRGRCVKFTSSLVEAYGDGGTSPCINQFHLYALDGSYTRMDLTESSTHRYYVVNDGYPTTTNALPVCRDCPSNFDVSTRAWSNDATQTGFDSSILYTPNYNSSKQSEIIQILKDIDNGLDPDPLWPPTGDFNVTPIYLNRLHQRQTPFYEPFHSTRAGNANYRD